MKSPGRGLWGVLVGGEIRELTIFFSTPKGKIVEFAIGVLQIEGSFSNLNILKGAWESEQYKLKLIEICDFTLDFKGPA